MLVSFFFLFPMPSCIWGEPTFGFWTLAQSLCGHSEIYILPVSALVFFKKGNLHTVVLEEEQEDETSS